MAWEHERESSGVRRFCPTRAVLRPTDPGTGARVFFLRRTRGRLIRAGSPNPIYDLFPPRGAIITPDADRDAMKLLASLNGKHLDTHPGDSRLEARIASFEMAARLQLSAPEVLDISKETEATRRLYGLENSVTEDFGRNCLVARRCSSAE